MYENVHFQIFSATKTPMSFISSPTSPKFGIKLPSDVLKTMINSNYETIENFIFYEFLYYVVPLKNREFPKMPISFLN